MSHHPDGRASTFWRVVLWVLLVLGLPLAWFAAIHAPNEYQAMLGLDALDCDGPLTTYLFASPVLLLYSVGLVFNALRWRKRTNLIAAGLCLGICVVVTLNVLDAVTEARRQGDACQRPLHSQGSSTYGKESAHGEQRAVSAPASLPR